MDDKERRGDEPGRCLGGRFDLLRLVPAAAYWTDRPIPRAETFTKEYTP